MNSNKAPSNQSYSRRKRKSIERYIMQKVLHASNPSLPYYYLNYCYIQDVMIEYLMKTTTRESILQILDDSDSYESENKDEPTQFMSNLSITEKLSLMPIIPTPQNSTNTTEIQPNVFSNTQQSLLDDSQYNSTILSRSSVSAIIPRVSVKPIRLSTIYSDISEPSALSQQTSFNQQQSQPFNKLIGEQRWHYDTLNIPLTDIVPSENIPPKEYKETIQTVPIIKTTQYTARSTELQKKYGNTVISTFIQHCSTLEKYQKYILLPILSPNDILKKIQTAYPTLQDSNLLLNQINDTIQTIEYFPFLKITMNISLYLVGEHHFHDHIIYKNFFKQPPKLPLRVIADISTPEKGYMARFDKTSQTNLVDVLNVVTNGYKDNLTINKMPKPLRKSFDENQFANNSMLNLLCHEYDKMKSIVEKELGDVVQQIDFDVNTINGQLEYVPFIPLNFSTIYARNKLKQRSVVISISSGEIYTRP
ncbi:hypothetical protein QTN25_010840 [Entamoeba marina]